jgi:hypothetical protein
MSEQYPGLLKQEKRRGNVFAGTVIICLFTPFILLLVFAQDWSNFAGGIALGIILAVIAAKLVRRFFRIRCPRCGSKNIQENYYGGKGSSDVAHTCTSCGARYNNGIQQQPT